MKEEIKAIWVLMFKRTKGWNTVQPILFHEYTNLKKHVCAIIVKHVEAFDDKYKQPIQNLYVDGRYDEIINLWKNAKDNMKKDLGFDLEWDDGPEVVL
jgi:hypothetical protein